MTSEVCSDAMSQVTDNEEVKKEGETAGKKRRKKNKK